MDPTVPVKEGTVRLREYKTWYRAVGDPANGKPPLLCLHGGPGATWDYFEPLEALAKARQLVFYDQLGGGNSDVPEDPSIHTIPLFIEEIETIRSELGLERVHLLGHSWGGMLAMEYSLTRPAGLVSLILSNTGASAAQWAAETRRLVDELPPELRRAVYQHEAAGTTDSEEYQEAQREFSRRHLSRRIDPRPDCIRRMSEKYGEKVYRYMWGPSEFHVTGTLKNWDITGRLGEIQAPTLIISGRYDEATPAIAETLQRGIPGSEWILFDKSGHFPQLEETHLYLRVLSEFLERVELALGQGDEAIPSL
jgi:proline-specific peptidase